MFIAPREGGDDTDNSTPLPKLRPQRFTVSRDKVLGQSMSLFDGIFSGLWRQPQLNNVTTFKFRGETGHGLGQCICVTQKLQKNAFYFLVREGGEAGSLSQHVKCASLSTGLKKNWF